MGTRNVAGLNRSNIARVLGVREGFTSPPVELTALWQKQTGDNGKQQRHHHNLPRSTAVHAGIRLSDLLYSHVLTVFSYTD